MHKDTAYGLVELSEDGPSTVVIRKKVADFKKRNDLHAVRDPVMGQALMQLWDQVSASSTGLSTQQLAAKFAECAANEGVQVEGQRQTVRRVRVLEQQTVIPIKRREGHPNAGKPYKGYLAGGNEFADVWQMPDKRKSWKIVAVPTFYAIQPDFDLIFLKKFRPHPAAKLLMRLHKNDMGALGEGQNRRIVRVRKFSDGNVMLDDHNQANVDKRERSKTIKRNSGHSATKLRAESFRKVGVDEIGRVRDPGPRKP